MVRFEKKDTPEETMKMRIIAQPGPGGTKKSSRKELPDYSSRRVQLRLMALVGMFMLIFLLAIEAAKPENWKWFFALADEATAEKVEEKPQGSSHDDTKMPPGAAPIARASSGTDATVTFSQPKGSPVVEKTTDPTVEGVLKNGWASIMERLNTSQRTMLFAMLDRATTPKPIKSEPSAAAKEDEKQDDQPKPAETAQGVTPPLTDQSLIAMLDTNWKEYFAAVEKMIAKAESSPDAERTKTIDEQWRQAAAKVEEDWRNTLHPTLQEVAAGKPVKESQRTALNQILKILESWALSRVQDLASYHYNREYDAWLRIWRRMSDVEGTVQLKKESDYLGEKSYRQLSDQMEEYRGKVVTINGRARLGSYQDISKNPLGVQGYYRLWIFSPKAETPFILDTLNLPKGFPAIAKTGKPLNFDEDVSITGVPFKLYFYKDKRSEVHTTPVLMTCCPDWTPKAPAEPLPGPLWFASVIGGALVVGLGVALAVYFSSSKTPDNKRVKSISGPDEAQTRLLAEMDLGPETGSRIEKAMSESETKTSSDDSEES